MVLVMPRSASWDDGCMGALRTGRSLELGAVLWQGLCLHSLETWSEITCRVSAKYKGL